MMNQDMSEVIQKINEMLKNNQIPDDIKHMMNQISSSSSENPDSENFSSGNSESSNQNSSEWPNFDMATLLKMKSIMDKMNQNQPDPRSDLLRSLKPYLRDSRKSKVDEYIKLFRMEKIFEVMGPLGGEKKNDV